MWAFMILHITFNNNVVHMRTVGSLPPPSVNKLLCFLQVFSLNVRCGASEEIPIHPHLILYLSRLKNAVQRRIFEILVSLPPPSVNNYVELLPSLQ